MRLVTFRKGSSRPRVGAPVADAILDLGALAADIARERNIVRKGRGGFPKTMHDLIAAGPDALAAAREALAHGEALLKRDGIAALTERRLGVAADKARLEAPIPRPARNVFCLGRNYKEHAAERGAEAPPHPVYFTKAPETVVAPGAQVIHHAVTKELDYEVELAVVIGKEGKDIPQRGGAVVRLRLHHHQRRDRARPPEAAPAVVPRQVARHVLSDGARPRHRRRDSRSADALGGDADQRRDAPVEPHVEDDLPGRRVHRGALAGLHDPSGRRDRDRHARGCGRRASASS